MTPDPSEELLIQRLAAAAPPLTSEQRGQLAALLGPAVVARDAHGVDTSRRRAAA